MSNITKIQNSLKAKSSIEKKDILERFFKTCVGEYSYGDIFIGVNVPEIRAVAKEFAEVSLDEVIVLLKSPIHEERMIALYFMVDIYKKGDEQSKKEIFDIYISHTAYINNWDLVDTSCYKIFAPYLHDKNKDIAFKFANSQNLWERRIAIVSTWHYIRLGEYKLTLEISNILLGDKEDLIHKAVGWMLREVGRKCGEDILSEYLDINYDKMARTTLRYAIERFKEPKRLEYLKRKQK